MNDREKMIIKGLECCLANAHNNCPYKSTDEGIDKVTSCTTYLMKDALALLKAQEPRVMTPADVCNIGPEDICAFVEIREETHMYACYMHRYDETHTEIMCDVPGLTTKLQKGYARLWTARPTDEQRKAVAWDE